MPRKEYSVAYFEQINKERPLDADESSRLDELLRREAWALAQRRYRETNAPILNQKRLAWYAANKERSSEYSRDYRVQNPESNRAACKRYRLKKKENEIKTLT